MPGQFFLFLSFPPTPRIKDQELSYTPDRSSSFLNVRPLFLIISPPLTQVMGVSNPWEEEMWWIQEKTDPFLTFFPVYNKSRPGRRNLDTKIKRGGGSVGGQS
jgi:hypothetical protein